MIYSRKKKIQKKPHQKTGLQLVFLISNLRQYGSLGFISTLLENFPLFSSNLKLLSANSYNLKESIICRFGKELLFIRQQKFRFIHTESRDSIFTVAKIMKLCLERAGSKHCGKRRK